MPILQKQCYVGESLSERLLVYTSPESSESHTTGATTEFSGRLLLLVMERQQVMKGVVATYIGDFTLKCILY